VCRFCSCPKQLPFFIAPLNLVDLLAILPFYLSLSLGKGQVRRPYTRAAACAGSPCRALPRLAAPCRALPRLAAPCRALPRRSQPTPGAARTRQIDPFGCRDDLDIDGNVFNQSAVGEDDGSGIPNLGFLRVVRGATLPQHSTHLHPHLDRSTAPTCPA
jgi:hypothetical protein